MSDTVVVVVVVVMRKKLEIDPHPSHRQQQPIQIREKYVIMSAVITHEERYVCLRRKQ